MKVLGSINYTKKIGIVYFVVKIATIISVLKQLNTFLDIEVENFGAFLQKGKMF